MVLAKRAPVLEGDSAGDISPPGEGAYGLALVDSSTLLQSARHTLWIRGDCECGDLAIARIVEGTMSYSLYIVVRADGTYYTGIAVDVGRRLAEHNGEKGRGARYTASRRPVGLVYQAPFATRSEALREEARIKRLTRVEKQKLI